MGVVYSMMASGNRMVGFEWEIQRAKNTYYGISFLLVILSFIAMYAYHHYFYENIYFLDKKMLDYISFQCFED
jgi:hypothetical protein